MVSVSPVSGSNKRVSMSFAPLFTFFQAFFPYHSPEFFVWTLKFYDENHLPQE
jgi:hypothetical protein